MKTKIEYKFVDHVTKILITFKYRHICESQFESLFPPLNKILITMLFRGENRDSKHCLQVEIKVNNASKCCVEVEIVNVHHL